MFIFIFIYLFFTFYFIYLYVTYFLDLFSTFYYCISISIIVIHNTIHTDQNWPTPAVVALDLANNILPLPGLGAEHNVHRVDTLVRAVGGHHGHIQAVDVLKLPLLRGSSAGHPGQLGGGPEEALVRDTGDGHRLW